MDEQAMKTNVVAIVGSYRKDGITHQIVDQILDSAKQNGANTEKIDLLDCRIEFCTNCRNCTTSNFDGLRGKCVISDSMDDILNKLDKADSIVLASPINFFTVTALFKRFTERNIIYGWWQWGGLPKSRNSNLTKKAVIVTCSACPGFIGKIMLRSAFKIMSAVAKLHSAKVVKKVYFGNVCKSCDQKLNDNQIKTARNAGKMLV
jgi:putative NADPH-quinone reductase